MDTPRAAALHDLKVVDFSRFLPGPMAAWLLAEFGAEVIRIEQPREVAKQEQLFRTIAGASADADHARAAQTPARNKRSLLIDPSHERGREVVFKLVAAADVLVEDYRPGVMQAMGYGYDAMRVINPRLVYCSVSFAGQSGPYSARPGHDPLALALAGALGLYNNSPEPALPNLQVADTLTGCLAAFGILTALHAREHTGQGQWVDAAMSDASTLLLSTALWRNGGHRQVATPGGAWVPKGGVWRCADDNYLCTTDMEPRYWQRFCAALGLPEYAELQSARERWPEMQAAIAARFAARPRSEWLAVLATADTQFMPVYSVEEAFADPHNIARGLPLRLPTTSGAWVDQYATPVRLSDTPGAVRWLAGRAGADNSDILAELGYDAAAQRALRDCGAVHG